MQEKNQSFILYNSYYEILADLENEDLGLIFKAILYYKKNDEILELPKHLLTIFKFIKNQLDLDAEKYTNKIEKLKSNGAKGGRPKKQNVEEEKPNGFLEKPKKANGFFTKPNESKQNHNVNVNDNVNVNVNDSFSFNKEKECVDEKKGKTDPYLNPIEQTFTKEYTHIMGSKPYLTAQEKQKLMELNAEIEDFKETIPEAISRLKKIKFKDINFSPGASWLLKKDNYSSVMNGEYEPKGSVWDELQEKETINNDKNRIHKSIVSSVWETG